MDPMGDAARAGRLKYAAFPLAEGTSYNCEGDRRDQDGVKTPASLAALLYEPDPSHGFLVHMLWYSCQECHDLRVSEEG